jgi:hypothetical protein
MTGFLVLFVLIQLIDVLTTFKAFQLGGEEALPVPRFLFESIGFWPTCALIKSTAFVVTAWVWLNVENGWIFAAVLTAIGLYVVVSNTRFILRNS